MRKINEGTYAIITGASSGIGLEIARELARRGANLILVARRRERLEQLKNEIVDHFKVDVVVMEVDLSIIENCLKLHEDTKKLNPKIIINNAGFGLYGFNSSLKLEREREMIRLNIESLHVLTKLYASSMEEGVILNVASMAGFVPTPMMASYAATKAYVASFSRALDYELRLQKAKIRVLSLCPGPVETEFGDVANAKQNVHAMKATTCAKIAVKGLLRRRPVIIPGAAMKTAYFFLKIMPTSWVLPAVYGIQKHK